MLLLLIYSNLFWEQRFTVMDRWVLEQCQEESDSKLQEFMLPEQVENLIESGKYSNVETRITKVQ